MGMSGLMLRRLSEKAGVGSSPSKIGRVPIPGDVVVSRHDEDALSILDAEVGGQIAEKRVAALELVDAILGVGAAAVDDVPADDDRLRPLFVRKFSEVIEQQVPHQLVRRLRRRPFHRRRRHFRIEPRRKRFGVEMKVGDMEKTDEVALGHSGFPFS